MKQKKWLSVLLALCMALSLLPVTALADGITDWAQLQAAFSEGGSIKLQQDVTAGADDSALIVPSGKEVTLDLNGYAIDRGLANAEAKTNGNVITNNGTLTITDTSAEKTGTITGGNNTVSGGCFVNAGTLTISGGTIGGNSAREAGAVLNQSGARLTVSGGTVENNRAFTFGGGAFVNHGTFSMSGGKVQNNTAAMNGGCLWSDGALTVTNGSISGNTAQQNGGAVYISTGTSEISGGSISGNTASSSGGAVYICDGTNTISGGTISGNTASAHGGAIYVYGNATVLNLFGGTIIGNTAGQQGGAILKYQDQNTVNIQGSPVIMNNQAASGPDIYLRNDTNPLNVTGALSADARIGVTLASGAGTVTFNYGQYNGPGQLACFIPGSSAYAIGADSSQEVVLGEPVTVSFAPGQGTGTMASVQVAKNNYYALPGCGFTPPAHQSFASWTVNGESYGPGRYVTIEANTTITATYAKHNNYQRVQAVTPTSTANGNIEYYICSECGRYFTYNGSTYTEVTASAIVLPYFTIAANGSEAIIQRYNGSDAEIVIPDTVPDNYPDETLRGRDITAVDQSAFENNTVITKVVMGDIIRLIRSRAFYNASNLKEIVIGSGLYTLESDVFNCPALTSFTCTATQPAEGYYPGLEIPHARVFGDCDISNITFYGMHSGAFHYSVWTVGFALGGGKRNYIGLDAHSDPTWTWAADLSSAEAVFDCDDCEFSGTLPATVTSEVTTPPTWTTPGVRTYTASVIVTGVTYTDTRTEEIPVPYSVTIANDIQFGTVTADREGGYAGDTVTLTAVPDYSTFISWNVTDENGDPVTVTNNTFTMPAGNVTVSAVFDPQYFTITPATVEHGTISADVQQARPGDTINLTASPDEGYRLFYWYPTGHIGYTYWTITPDDDSGVFYAKRDANSFVMPAANVTVSAGFEPIVYPIYVGGRQVTYANADDVFEDGGSVRYDAETYTLTLTDATIASQWSDDWDYWLLTNEKTNIVAGGDLKIVLNGKNILSSDPDTAVGIEVFGGLTIGGTGSLTYCSTCEYGNGIAAYGPLSLEDRITLRISTDVGEPFSADFIALDGTDLVIADTLEIILPGNPLIEDGTLFDMDNEVPGLPGATYGFPTSVVIGPAGTPVLPYAVTIADDIPYGTVTADRDRGNAGDTVTLTAVPDYSTFVSWNVTDENGDPVTVTNNTFTLPDGDVTVSAVFDPQYFTVTTATVAHGSISADAQQARPGDTISLTADPDEGYRLMFWNPSGHIGGTNWTIRPDDNSGVFYAAEGADSFVMPAANVTVTARFEAITYPIFVGGRQVTYANADDVFGDGGSVRYDAANNTLTLTDATIASQWIDEFDYWLITNNKTNICAGDDLKIVLSGNNILSSDPDTDIGIEVLGSLTIGGTGSLTYCCTCEYGKGIAAYGPLSLEDRITLRISTAVGEPFSADFIALRGSTDFVIADTLEIILPGNPLIEDGTLYDMDNEAPSYPWATYGFPTSVLIGPEGTPVIPYTVTIADDILNGTVTADRVEGNAGDTITLTVSPDEGYVVDTVTVNGTAIEPVDGQYAFEMPAQDVTVSAVFTLCDDPDQAAADEVIALINDIGEVEYTEACKAKIDAAKEAFDALTDTQKALVANADTLTAAIARYNELKPATEHTHRFTEQPEYVWAEDFSTCTAVFTCAECGDPVSYPMTVNKQWQSGPDEYGRGKYYYVASLTVNETSYADFTVVFEAEGDVPANLCKWCEQDHSGSVWQRIVGFFHSILYFFAHLFGQR